MAAEFRGTQDIVLADYSNKKIVIGPRTSATLVPTWTYTFTIGTKAMGVSTKVPAGDDFVFASYDKRLLLKGIKGTPNTLAKAWNIAPLEEGFGQL